MIFKIIKRITLQTHPIKKMKFHYKVYKLAYDNRDLFSRHYNHSVVNYLIAGSKICEEGFIYDWWQYSFTKSPFSLEIYLKIYFFNPDELLCIIDHTRRAIKSIYNEPKHSEYKEIYTEMAQKFNSFCEDLEKISKKFPDLCKGLSYIEKLPN